jgi:hypothetical protein
MAEQQEWVPDPVTERALVQRINRRLAEEGWERLIKARTGRARQQMGTWFMIDERSKLLVSKFIDLERFGRELGVLGEDERLEG